MVSPWIIHGCVCSQPEGKTIMANESPVAVETSLRYLVNEDNFAEQTPKGQDKEEALTVKSEDEDYAYGRRRRKG
jgi:hypothetical protein